MRTPHPMTETMKASEARQHFANVLNRVFRKEARVVVEKSGIPVAAIVSADDLSRLDRLDRERAARFALLDELRAAFAGVSAEEIEGETDRITAEIRAEGRSRQDAAQSSR